MASEIEWQVAPFHHYDQLAEPGRETFGDRLRSAREVARLTQAELAQRTGFMPSAISHFENGHRTPSLANFRRLVVALGVSANYLLGT